MADNVPITAGSGTNIATDDAGAGGHVQVVKLAISADGSATVIPADATNGIDVDVTRVQGTVTVDSELPAAAALSDSIANPTSPMVGAGGMIWGGSDWRRARQAPSAFGVEAVAGTGFNSVALHHETGGYSALASANFAGATNGGDNVAATQPYWWSGVNYVRAPGDATNGLDVDVTRTPRVTTATLANVASSATSVTIDALNTARLGMMIHNDSTAILYLKYGATASATSYTVRLDPGVHWEMPEPVYTGVIDGIWSAANGNARVTEMTA